MTRTDTIYSRFRMWTDRHPQAIAVKEDGRSVTFGELDRMSAGVTLALAGAPAAPSVGIVMSHRAEMIAAMLGVLRSGMAYVPAEPSLPSDRIRYMMDTAGVKTVIDDAFFDSLPAAPAASDPADRSTPDSVAYILYTSGTSGRPKGVIVENHSVVNYAEAFEAEFHAAPGDVMLQYSVCSFDIFVEEVFATLLNGAAIAIPSREVCDAGLPALMEFVNRHGATMISGFPYLLAEMNHLPAIPASLRLLISGGDVLRGAYIDRLRHMGPQIYNTYGPSETTVCATYHRCDNCEPLPDGTFPVGYPVKGVTVKVMDSHGREVPAGKVGEICIFGPGVSRGYLGRVPEQRNFVTLSDGSRMYRSGDLGYILPDGNLAFLRRRDDQVMILGKRVEPSEVENVLSEAPEVERAVVRAFLDDSGLAYLVAYVVPARHHISLSDLRHWLASKLTDFMVPEFFVALREIPLNSHGKVDVASLPVVLKEGAVA
ncbi:MAG: amino acid adenylation domain-containing protein [Candidatus Amulumruptor caecigallinarius]|nr:amino acid adenylation domain-containing protein [Candidatus Amulumruptor caecigallinarius]MCM1397495.1 amino acid adenylation domain-containing protein [Candidatus Amulumruptor caecigallinarius]MCM1454397.1 amino acid adenylation domain-containing protein [bacterium]